MAENPIPSPLPADLPTNWTYGQTVAPTGAEAGLATQYGYNYLMAAVNAAQSAINTIGQAFLGLATTGDLSSLSSVVSGLNSDLTALQNALNSLSGVVNAHISSKNNPHEVTAAQVGAASILYGTYDGTGAYGASSPTTLVSNFSPNFVIIEGRAQESPSLYYYAFLLRDSPRGILIASSSWSMGLQTTWERQNVSFYNTSSAGSQMNNSGWVYTYVMIG